MTSISDAMMQTHFQVGRPADDLLEGPDIEGDGVFGDRGLPHHADEAQRQQDEDREGEQRVRAQRLIYFARSISTPPRL